MATKGWSVIKEPRVSKIESPIPQAIRNALPSQQETASQQGRGWTAIPREVVEAMDNTTIDILPNDAGVQITSPLGQRTIYKQDFNESMSAAFDDLINARDIEKEIELKGLRNTGRETIPVYGAIEILGRGLAGSIHSIRAGKELDKQMSAYIETSNAIADRYKEARDSGDTEGAKKLLELLKVSTDYNPAGIDFLQGEIDRTPTPTQVGAAAAELSLLATSGPIGRAFKSAVMPLGVSAVKGTTAAILLNTVKRYGLSAISSGTSLALWSATGAGKIEDASVEDIIDAAEGGAKTGVVLGPAFMAAGDLLKAGIKWAGPHMKQFYKEAVTRLEKAAAGKKGAIINPVDKALATIEQEPTISQIAAKTTLKGIHFLEKMEQRFIDRFSPLARAENRIRELKGTPLAEKEKIYRDIRMIDPWADGIAEKKIVSFIDKLDDFSPDIKQKSKAWLVTLDKIDRVKLGLEVPGKQTLPQLKNELAELGRYIGIDDMKQVSQVRKLVKQYTTKELLEDVSAGLLSKKEMETILKAHPHYIPNSVVMDRMEKNISGVGTSMDVTQTNLKRATGHLQEIKDPYEAMLLRTPIHERVRQKNILMNNLVDAQEQYGAIPGMRKLVSGEKLGDSEAVISFFKDGVKQSWVVPDTIGAAIKSTDIPISPKWWSALTAPQRALKKGATAYNPAFILGNKFRDEHAAALTASSFIDDAAKKYGLNPTNAKSYSYKELTNIYQKGGFGASIFQEGDDAMIQALQRGKLSTTFEYNNIKSLNPLDAIKRMNTFAEQSTRKEVLAKALKAGLSEKDALFVSRNATLDFAKIGTWMRVPNQAIPFLNARVQGLVNIPKAFMSSPERFSEAVMNTAVLPTMLLHQHNRRYESYKYLSQGIKDSNWIIMTGEIPATNPYNGDEILVPQFITIKRGEGQSLVSAPIRHWLEKEDGIDSRKVSQMLADSFGSVSPVDFGTYSRQNLWGSVISQFGPLASMAAGGFSNKHPYFGTDIVPSYRKEGTTGAELHKELQFAPKTPEILKQAIPKEFYRSGFAETFNISPATVDFYVSVFGGMPQDVLRGLDIAYGVVRDGKMGGLNVTDTTWETLTEIPVIRGFLKQSLSNVTDADRRLVSDVTREVGSDDQIVKDRANEIVSTLRTLKTKTEKQNYWNLLGDELTPALMLQIVRRSDINSIVDGLSKFTDKRVSAIIINQKVEQMKGRGEPASAIQEYLGELLESGVLTKPVLEEMIKYLQE
ncbi:MAG: LPD38 domain-containing protein [Candidatus Methanomethylophilaceae archaeon]|jgi:hypothetical protein